MYENDVLQSYQALQYLPHHALYVGGVVDKNPTEAYG